MKQLVLLIAMMLCLTTGALAQKAPAESGNPAITFLERVEKKNESTKALTADFKQVRVNRTFEETVESEGKFWYKEPGKYRASYTSENDSEIWILDDKLINYVPSLEQVEIIPQATGDDAPINQILLGFGVKVEKILKYFDVSPASEQRDGQYGIVFQSKDTDKSMGYDRIIVYFDQEKVEPRTIVLEDEESKITVDLKKVKLNPEINDSVFEPKWPDTAEVLEYK